MSKIKKYLLPFIVFFLISQNAFAVTVTEQWDAVVTGKRNLSTFFSVNDTISWQVTYDDNMGVHSNVSFSGALFDDIIRESVSFDSEFNIGTNDQRYSTVDVAGNRNVGFNRDFQLTLDAFNSIAAVSRLTYKYNILSPVGISNAISSELLFSVTNVSDVAPSTVPVPAAAWLFGSALLGFLGFSKRRKA